MSSIDVLMGLRDLVKANKDHYLATAKEQDISRCGSSGDITRDLANDCEREIEALTEAIEALEKVQGIKGHIRSLSIPPHPIDDPDPQAEAFNEALYHVSKFIDSLDK